MEKILIIDDEEFIRATVDRVLKEEGYQVLPAVDGRSALELVASEEIDLALLDLNLGREHGIDVLEEARDVVAADPGALAVAVPAEVEGHAAEPGLRERPIPPRIDPVAPRARREAVHHEHGRSTRVAELVHREPRTVRGEGHGPHLRRAAVEATDLAARGGVPEVGRLVRARGHEPPVGREDRGVHEAGVAELRDQLRDPLTHRVDNWSSTSTWCTVAEAAAVAGDVRLAARLVDLLEPLKGRIAVSGISTVMGPVDGYLALALATTDRRGEAAGVADRAAGQAREWGFDAYAAWLGKRRGELGF